MSNRVDVKVTRATGNTSCNHTSASARASDACMRVFVCNT